jgi:hypothetical protein
MERECPECGEEWDGDTESCPYCSYDGTKYTIRDALVVNVDGTRVIYVPGCSDCMHKHDRLSTFCPDLHHLGARYLKGYKVYCKRRHHG